MQPEPVEMMSPEAYNAIIAQITPLEIRLSQFQFELATPVHSGPLVSMATLDEADRTEPAPAHDGGFFVTISQRATFKVQASDQAVAAFGAAEFQIRLLVGFQAPAEFWKLFLARNVKLYTHPALRDLVASTVARAGLVATPLASVSVTQTVRRSSMAMLPQPD